MRGFTQQYGVDYIETFAPIVYLVSLHYLLAMAVRKNLIIHQIDIKSAYLTRQLEEEIYIVLPEGFNTQERACWLVKCLYSLKQLA